MLKIRISSLALAGTDPKEEHRESKCRQIKRTLAVFSKKREDQQ
jgi:hypothetical protein